VFAEGGSHVLYCVRSVDACLLVGVFFLTLAGELTGRFIGENPNNGKATPRALKTYKNAGR
jgi:hypothetical protein